jgi:hypothetical protein
MIRACSFGRTTSNRGDLNEYRSQILNTGISNTAKKTHFTDPRSTESRRGATGPTPRQVEIVECYALPVHVEFNGGPAIVSVSTPPVA